MMRSIRKTWYRARRIVAALVEDRRGVAAIEFAMIVPIMLVMFFGTVEFSSGVAVDRKVTLIARTLSDLTSQTGVAINDAYLQNVFTAAIAIMTPYSPTPTKATLSEIYVNSAKKATIQWSRSAIISGANATQATLTTSTYTVSQDVTSMVPAQLLVAKTYLILSQVNYLYTPTIGYVMSKAGVNLSDVAYTRPRQLTCVIYNNLPVTPPATCPLT
jgi:Flp pilus assembly protein TadG